MFSHLRRFDVQATYGCILSVSSTLPALAAAWMLLERYRSDLGQILYGSRGLFFPVFLGCVGVSIVLAGLGFVLGWNSAGRRRNDKPMRSWLGFFIGGGTLTLDITMMLAFLMLRLEKPM